MQNFEDLLQSVVSVFMRSKDFWREFIESGGEIDLVLNGSVVKAERDPELPEFEPKVFEVTLHPKFLEVLTIIPVAPKIQMWG